MMLWIWLSELRKVVFGFGLLPDLQKIDDLDEQSCVVIAVLTDGFDEFL